MSTFITRGTCSKAINFDIEDGKVANVSFQGGCNGNTKGISMLVEGMPVAEVIDKLLPAVLVKRVVPISLQKP